MEIEVENLYSNNDEKDIGNNEYKRVKYVNFTSMRWADKLDNLFIGGSDGKIRVIKI